MTPEREMEREALDAWCKAQAANLTARVSGHITTGGDLNDPEYRRLLGQHQAYMRVRSFLSGMKRPDHLTQGSE